MCFFFQQKLRKSLFSLSLSFLLEKVGGEGEKKLEKEEKKKKPNSLFKSRRGFLLRKNLQHTFDTAESTHPVGGLRACPVWVRRQTNFISVMEGHGGSTLPQLQGPPAAAGQGREEKRDGGDGGNRLKSVPRVGDQKESTLGTVWENLCKCRHQNLT